MPKVMKKPVVVDAFQWSGSNVSELCGWALAALREHRASDYEDVPLRFTERGDLEIDTLEGAHRANVGDWIICGVRGEFYPCKPEIFEATYERA